MGVAWIIGCPLEEASIQGVRFRMSRVQVRAAKTACPKLANHQGHLCREGKGGGLALCFFFGLLNTFSPNRLCDFLGRSSLLARLLDYPEKDIPQFSGFNLPHESVRLWPSLP